MQEIFEKIIEKLESEAKRWEDSGTEYKDKCEIAVGRGLRNAIEIVKQEAGQYNNGWVPCSDRLPEDCDNRFYMCIVENHEEDLPMFCQYDEEYGFGFWHDIYDEHTLGFVDSEFKTNEELGYEKVIAWQQLLPYQPKGE